LGHQPTRAIVSPADRRRTITSFPRGGDPTGDVHEHLDRLIDELKDGGRIRTAPVERAFRTVERHRFLRGFSRWDPATSRPVPVAFDPALPSEEALRVIYSDQALGTRFRDGLPSSSSSQPSVMADMLEALELEPGMRVLEIGTGTGYNAALLAEIVGSRGSVVTLDIDAGIATEAEKALTAMGYGSVQVVVRDGAEGVPEDAAFDRILVTVGCPDLSVRWQEQLTEEGRMVVPLEHAGLHPLVLLTKGGQGLEGRFIAWTAFIPIRGLLHQELPWPPVFVRERETDAARELPAWEGFGIGTPIPGWGIPGDVMDFFLFLALTDRRAVALPPPPSSIGDRWEVGLTDSSGSALAGSGGIRASGDQDLLADLMRHHDSWEEAARPAIGDWHMTFTSGNAGTKTPVGLVVERANYRQVVTRAN
jgi:protein-L-isoaspartate(D-aspartate) O-methyltransferase